MPGITSTPGILSHERTLSARAAFTSGGILTISDHGWTPLTANPYLYLDAQTGVQKSGGAPASYLDSVPTWINQGTGNNATQSTESSQPIYLPHHGRNYLNAPDTSSGAYNYNGDTGEASSDITLEWEGMLFEYDPAETVTFLNRWRTDYDGREWKFSLLPGGTLQLNRSPDGATEFPAESTVPVDAIDGEDSGFRVVRNRDTGLTRFYQKIGGSWQQLGDAIPGNTLPIFNNTGNMFGIGFTGTAADEFVRGKTYRIRVWDTSSPDQTSPIVDVDFDYAPGGMSAFTCRTGQTISLWNNATIVADSCLYFDGSNDSLTGTFASAIPGCRIFSVLSARTPAANIRAFSLAGSSGSDTSAPGGFPITATSSSRLASYVGGGFRVTHANNTFNGRFTCEALVASGNHKLRRAGLQLTSTATTNTNATKFGIGGKAAGTIDATFAKMQLELLAVFPPTMRDVDVFRMRRYLTKRTGLPA